MHTKKTYLQPHTTWFQLQFEAHILSASKLKTSEKVVTTQEYSNKRNDFDIWGNEK